MYATVCEYERCRQADRQRDFTGNNIESMVRDNHDRKDNSRHTMRGKCVISAINDLVFSIYLNGYT